MGIMRFGHGGVKWLFFTENNVIFQIYGHIEYSFGRAVIQLLMFFFLLRPCIGFPQEARIRSKAHVGTENRLTAAFVKLLLYGWPWLETFEQRLFSRALEDKSGRHRTTILWTLVKVLWSIFTAELEREKGRKVFLSVCSSWWTEERDQESYAS